MTTLLLVDDEKNIIELSKLYFENEGYKVESARDDEDFLNGCSFAGSWTTSVDKSNCIMSLKLNNNNVTGADCNGQITGTLSYGPGVIYLSGRNTGVAGGDFLMYLADYQGFQFRGSFDSGQYEWCGWRQNSSMPDPCFMK